MAMLAYSRISPGELRLSGTDLFCEHQAEAGLPLLGANLEPQWDLMQAMFDRGDLIAVGAFHQGTLVGYATAVLGPHLNTGQECAAVTTVYLDPNYRSGAGDGLREALRDEAKAAGAVRILWSAKPGSKLDYILSKSKSLSIVEHVYSEELKNG